MIPCPICGATGTRRLHDPKTGQCKSEYGCLRRRCERRKDEDRKRDVREQCHGTFGMTSIRFCELRAGHKGLHLHGTQEWGGNFEHPLAKVIRAGTGT